MGWSGNMMNPSAGVDPMRTPAISARPSALALKSAVRQHSYQWMRATAVYVGCAVCSVGQAERFVSQAALQ
jgi:hypothetical protein